VGGVAAMVAIQVQSVVLFGCASLAVSSLYFRGHHGVLTPLLITVDTERRRTVTSSQERGKPQSDSRVRAMSFAQMRRAELRCWLLGPGGFSSSFILFRSATSSSMQSAMLRRNAAFSLSVSARIEGPPSALNRLPKRSKFAEQIVNLCSHRKLWTGRGGLLRGGNNPPLAIPHSRLRARGMGMTQPRRGELVAGCSKKNHGERVGDQASRQGRTKRQKKPQP
jgi:hypothetical protein